MVCYILPSKLLKKSSLHSHHFFANDHFLFICITNSKPWECFISFRVTNEKIVPYQLIFTKHKIELRS